MRVLQKMMYWSWWTTGQKGVRTCELLQRIQMIDWDINIRNDAILSTKSVQAGLLIPVLDTPNKLQTKQRCSKGEQ